MFGNFEIAHHIATAFYRVDTECRDELRIGDITCEEDYVSNFTRALRKEFRNRLHLVSRTLPKTQESKFGADGLIIFRYGNKVKIGIFEAKWPRISTSYSWDRCKKPSGLSHFSSQLSRQRLWRRQFAIWEMFFNEEINGVWSPPFDHFGSSCLWHHHAYHFAHRNCLIFEKWRTTSLAEALHYLGVNFYHIIFDIISCRAGSLINITETSDIISVINDIDEEVRLDIPIINQRKNDSSEINSVDIEEFMKKNGFASYLYLDFSDYRDLK